MSSGFGDHGGGTALDIGFTNGSCCCGGCDDGGDYIGGIGCGVRCCVGGLTCSGSVSDLGGGRCCGVGVLVVMAVVSSLMGC